MTSSIVERVTIRAKRAVFLSADLALQPGQTIELDALTAGEAMSGGRAELVDEADRPKVKAAFETVGMLQARAFAQRGKDFSAADFRFGKVQ